MDKCCSVRTRWRVWWVSGSEEEFQERMWRNNVASWIGWVATVVFASSYFCRRPETLRLVQAGAASLWLGYGILLEAPPVIVSNLVVIGLAIGSTWRERRRMRVDSCAGEGSPPQ